MAATTTASSPIRILGGKPIIKGTRIAVDLGPEELAYNPDVGELLAAHPDLSADDVGACLAYPHAVLVGEEAPPRVLLRSLSVL